MAGLRKLLLAPFVLIPLLLVLAVALYARISLGSPTSARATATRCC